METTATVTVAKARLPELRKAIAKLAKKAEKLGFDAPIFRLIEGTDTVIAQEAIGFGWHHETGVYIEAIDIEIMSPEIGRKGWMFEGVIELHPEGNRVARSDAWAENGFPADPAWFTMSDSCDHCGVARNRKRLVVIHHRDEGRKIVGTQCANEYLQIEDAHKLADLIWKLSEFHLFAEDRSFGPGGDDSVVPTQDWLGVCLRVVEVDGGYVSGGGTRDAARSCLFGKKASEARAQYGPFEQRHYDQAGEIIEYAKSMTTGGNEWKMNLRSVAGREMLNWKSLGLVASMSLLAADVEKKKFEKVDRPTSVHVGEVKKREVYAGEIVMVREFDGTYGVRVMLKLRDDDGNVLVWWTGEDQVYLWNEKLERHTMLAKGDRISGKATVKKHDTYNGEAQTVLTRWKVDEVEWNAAHNIPGIEAEASEYGPLGPLDDPGADWETRDAAETAGMLDDPSVKAGV